MASPDPLLLLKAAIAASKPPVLTKSSDPASAEANVTDSLVDATDLYFTYPTQSCIPLTAITRFTSTTPDTAQVDLRSIFFAWLQKDVTVPEYIASAAELDKQLPEGQRVRNLVFVERIDLITWLEGASDESEYVKPIEGADGVADAALKAANVAGGTGVPTTSGTGVGVTQTVGGRAVKVIDARLQIIYNGERKMGDHNTVLRGIKPSVRRELHKFQFQLTMVSGFLTRQKTRRVISWAPKRNAICTSRSSSEISPTSKSASSRAIETNCLSSFVEKIRSNHPFITFCLISFANDKH